MKLDVIAAGSAGQGVVTVASILARAAIREGFDAHYTAHSGISQLEGSVTAHIRIGTPSGASPKIMRKGADAILALDLLEALRIQPWLGEGKIAIIDTLGHPPVAVRASEGRYPTREEVEKAYAYAAVHWIPATETALALGAVALAGAVMLGALAALVPTVERDHLVLTLRDHYPSVADLEVEAFFAGYRHVSGEDH
jgi:indolepyruvate ferredoxin oxidoreductase beta subunit